MHSLQARKWPIATSRLQAETNYSRTIRLFVVTQPGKTSMSQVRVRRLLCELDLGDKLGFQPTTLFISLAVSAHMSGVLGRLRTADFVSHGRQTSLASDDHCCDSVRLLALHATGEPNIRQIKDETL